MSRVKRRRRASRPVVIWSDTQEAVIVSDIHLGSRFSHCDAFLTWLDGLPRYRPVVLNGDILDDPRDKLFGCHHRALNRLIKISFEREVVWVLGNHDDDLLWDKLGRITIARHLEIGKTLLAIHGDDFDDVMPKSRAFIRMFKYLHFWRQTLGAPHVHVAHYAKKWKAFYNVLNENVKKNAVASAKRNGFGAVACGHTHYALDITYDGIRYLNTGAWTEEPLHYVEIQDRRIQMKVFSL